jgi:hypothetical protein
MNPRRGVTICQRARLFKEHSMKDQFYSCSFGINIFLNALKADLPVIEVGGCLNEMLERKS